MGLVMRTLNDDGYRKGGMKLTVPYGAAQLCLVCDISWNTTEEFLKDTAIDSIHFQTFRTRIPTRYADSHPIPMSAVSSHSAIQVHQSTPLTDVPNLVDTVCSLLVTRWAAPSPRFPEATATGGDVHAPFISYTYHPEYFESADPFECAALHRVPLPHYVDRVFRYMTGSDVDCLLGALRLIDRYHLETGCTIAHHNAHLVFFVALMVSTKCMSDVAHRIDYYSRVAAVPRHQLTQLELIVTFECRWDILPQPWELKKYASLLNHNGQQEPDLDDGCSAPLPPIVAMMCTANDSIVSEDATGMGMSMTSDVDGISSTVAGASLASSCTVPSAVAIW